MPFSPISLKAGDSGQGRPIAGLEAWLIGTGATVDRVGRVCSCDIADRRYRGGYQAIAAKRR